jgi:hypothetical protein
MLQQTSKWVKNTFVFMNIFWYIDTEWKGVPSEDFSDWLRFYEIGLKTGSLIFHAAYGKMMTLPVNSHVWHAFHRWDGLIPKGQMNVHGRHPSGWIHLISLFGTMSLVPLGKH